MRTDPLEEKLREIIVSKIEQDKLALPSMPAVAAKCLSILRNPKADLAEISAEVERDPVAAAYVLRLANSAALRTQATVETIPAAVQKLGTENLRTLFLHMAARALFESKDPRITQTFLDIWRHSVAVAVLSRDVAALTGGADIHVAYESGLLHDVGKPIIGLLLLQLEKSASGGRRSLGLDSKIWLRAVHGVHRSVAVALAKKWKLPAAVRQSIETCAVYDEANPKCAPNIVRFANAITKRMGLFAGDVDETETENLVTVGHDLLGLDKASMTRVTSTLDARVRELVA